MCVQHFSRHHRAASRYPTMIFLGKTKQIALQIVVQGKMSSKSDHFLGSLEHIMPITLHHFLISIFPLLRRYVLRETDTKTNAAEKKRYPSSPLYWERRVTMLIEKNRARKDNRSVPLDRERVAGL